MRRRVLIGLVVSVLIVAGVVLFWPQGKRAASERAGQSGAGASAGRLARQPQAVTTNQFVVSASTAPAFLAGAKSGEVEAKPTNPLAYRLANTSKPVGQLLRDDRAILLENALIDTTQPLGFQIPERLRAEGDPGSYLVQSRGAADAAFRAALTAAGAELVSYIPNNAWLVRASADVAKRLTGQPQIQTVLPWEPIYKLKAELLQLAMEEKPLADDAKLNLLVFGGAQAAVAARLQQMNVTVLNEDRSPFGTVITVEPPEDWVALARVSGVQLLEQAYRRARANDRTRVRLGIAEDTQTQTNYLGLTGTNVLVNMNDFGVDDLHPDLAGRVFANNPAALVDTDGHGTHVAGIIMGSGLMSTNVLNARGSLNPGTNNQYRGMAPGAELFVQRLGSAPNFTDDNDLQESIVRTNAFISNNSWVYQGASGYSLASASYDAAVRDSLPGTPGSQPVLYVFAAGNAGSGSDEGTAGAGGSVLAPGTAKNVMTVGALELARDITNIVEKVTGTSTNTAITNSTAYWKNMTSSENQVAAFSSRGNVGIGIEGEFGRFKPDVVAPGTFVISTRSTEWDEIAYYNPTNHKFTLIANRFVDTNTLLPFPLNLPQNAVGFSIRLLANEDSPIPFPNLPIYVRRDGVPTTALFDLLRTNFVAVPPDLGGPGTDVGQNWFYAIRNRTSERVFLDILTEVITTNELGNYYTVLSNLNNSISSTNALPGVPPNFYRYESGTSMAAPAVSGMLALMQEFFEQRLLVTNSPALMKALLINGARSASETYRFNVRNTINYQGWGLARLENSLQPGISNAFNKTIASPATSMLVYDQSPTNALATGQQRTWAIELDEEGQILPLRVTLAWTDPPGNPAAGVKLVNDLDLIITNKATGEIYLGNDFNSGSLTTAIWDTNDVPNIDSVNNVENIYLPAPLDTNYIITVVARRVNVNAVTAHTNDTVQDFALVISSGSGEGLTAIRLTEVTASLTNQIPDVVHMTNSINAATFSSSTLENQRVGANTPLLGTTNGILTQWKFYVLTNGTDFTNASFLVSQQTDLAIPRQGVNSPISVEATRRYADVDLYVSTNPALTNLDAAVLAASSQSRSRNDFSGDEFVTFTNSSSGATYYVGVKSEDHQAAQFEFWGIFSLLPLGAEDANGYVQAYPMRGYEIPDGSSENPGGTRFVAITRPSISGGLESVRRVLITNNVSHARYADLINTMDHNSRVVVLDNHRELLTPLPPGPYELFYDDSGEGDHPTAVPPDGPGTFESFIGELPGGTWYFTYSDNALDQTGRVNDVRLRIERQREDDGESTNSVGANSWIYFSRNVPVEATNLTICVDIISGTPGPLQLYVRKDRRPTQTIYDHALTINPPGDCLEVDKSSLPPLTAGRYFIGIFNPNPTTQTFVYSARLGLGVPPTPLPFNSVGGAPLLDDAVTNHTIFMTNDARIATIDVGLRIDHPRVSDLAVTLISPRGTRVLLAENRGGLDPNGFGTSLVVSNFVPVAAAGGPASTNFFIDTGATVGTVTIDYDFFNVPDQMTVYYESVLLTDTGMTDGAGRLTLNYGPGASTIIEVRMNEFGNTNIGTAWNFTASSINSTHSYLTFTENTNLTTTPIKFAAPPFTGAAGTNYLISDFELPGTSAGNYISPGPVDGWAVLTTNSVTVVTNTAYTNQQSLALRSGVIGRTFPTILGRNYRLGYAYRKEAQCFQYTNFSSIAGLALNGSASQNGNILRLTPAAGGNIGSAWYVAKQTCVNGFDTSFRFQMAGFGSDPGVPIGGDGFTFSVQNVGTTQGWSPSATSNNVTINFNTFLNWPGCTDYSVCDVSENSVGLYINQTYIAQTDLNPLGINLSDAAVHTAQIIYTPNGRLTLWIDGVPVLVNVSVPNLAPGVDGNGQAWVGFSATAGAAWETHDILDWTFCSSGTFSGADIFVPGQVTNSFLGDTNWQLGGLIFNATSNNTVVNLAPVSSNAPSGVLVDYFTLTETAGPRYVLPEESLKVLEGENAYGLWQLEILDTRTGATNNVSLVDWSLQFIFQTNTALPRGLTSGVIDTRTIPPGQTYYYIVDVPLWARFATNSLLAATGPLNVYFNQNILPTGTNTAPPDYHFFIGATSGTRTMTTNLPAAAAPNGTPLLVPGQRYYLALVNPSATTPVTYSFLVEFDLAAFPGFISLTNGIPYCSFNPGPGVSLDYYRYTVSSNALRAQFEINNLTGDMALLLRRDLPPTFGVFDYFSANTFTNDEVITVFDFSQPVPLTPGDWYLAAANISGGPVSYCVKATEWPVYGTNIVITNVFLGSNSFCLTWTSLPGVHYFVEGLTDLNSTNWVTVSPTITAVDYSTTYCIPLPSPFHFFRVREGIALSTYYPPPFIFDIRRVFQGIQLTWSGPTNLQYEVQWTPLLVPATWTAFTNPPAVSSSSGVFLFLDDGSETGGFTGTRFYRLLQLP